VDNKGMRFEVFMAMKFKSFSSRLKHREDGGSMVLRNVAMLTHHYTSSQPRRLRLEHKI